MNKRHKHYETIVAWASGKEIQFFDSDENQWRDWGYTSCPSFTVTSEWRIKPTKNEGWVNLYKCKTGIETGMNIYDSEETAKNASMDSKYLVDTIKIEWER